MGSGLKRLNLVVTDIQTRQEFLDAKSIEKYESIKKAEADAYISKHGFQSDDRSQEWRYKGGTRLHAAAVDADLASGRCLPWYCDIDDQTQSQSVVDILVETYPYL